MKSSAQDIPHRRLPRAASPAVALISAGVLLLQLVACSEPRQTEPPSSVVRLDPRIDALIPHGANLEKIADGFTWVEGPVWNRDGFLLFSDVPNNTIFKWSERTGAQVFLKPSGYTGVAPATGIEPGSNGLTLDDDGRLIVCEHGDRRVTRLEADGTKTVLADRYEGKRLNSPNDVVLRDGDLYFTDPPYGLPKTFDDPQRELSFSGIYRIDAKGKLTLLNADLRAPNGIAFAPSGGFLYVSNSDRRQPQLMAFDVAADGALGAARVFFDATKWTETYPGSADGMKVDKNGNVFATGPGGIFVLAPDGTLIGRIVTGVATSNCAWGGNGSELYITASTGIYKINLTTRGQ